MIELTDQERHVLRHTLTGSSGTDEVYRNYFAASDGHHDMPALTRLVMHGLMYVGEIVPGSTSLYYHCTAQGAMAIGLHAPHDMRMAMREA
jgi:hypothetical protein